MILEILSMVVSFAKAAVTAPDVKPEYYDIDLETLGQNQNFVDRLIATLPTDTDGMKYPESEAKKKLKRVMDLYYQILDFQKYLDSKAAEANEERRKLLVALAVLDAELAHEASVLQFWESLDDEYIQYLQDRINKIEQERANLYNQLRHLNFEINQLQKRIEVLDKDIEKEVIKLIDIAESRAEAVSKVVDDAVQNHLDVFAELNTHLTSLIQQKTEELHEAEQALMQYDKENPQGGIERESFVGTVNTKKEELDKVVEALGKVKAHSEKLINEHDKLSKDMTLAKAQFNSAHGFAEKLATVDKLEQVICGKELLFNKSGAAIPSLQNDLRHLLDSLPAEQTSFIETTFNKVNDFTQQMETATSEGKDKLAATQAIIQDKMKIRNKVDQELDNHLQQAKTLTEKIHNHNSKLENIQNEIKSINPKYVDKETISQFNPKDKELVSSPTTPRMMRK